MAINSVANPISLAFAVVGGGNVTIGELVSASVESSNEFPAANMGTALVDSHFRGKQGGSFTVETTKLTNVVGLVEGAKVTGITLTAGAALESNGTAIGGNITKTMSKGIIEKITDPALSNASRQKASMQITIRLSRHENDTEDPTIGAWTEVT